MAYLTPEELARQAQAQFGDTLKQLQEGPGTWGNKGSPGYDNSMQWPQFQGYWANNPLVSGMSQSSDPYQTAVQWYTQQQQTNPLAGWMPDNQPAWATRGWETQLPQTQNPPMLNAAAPNLMGGLTDPSGRQGSYDGTAGGVITTPARAAQDAGVVAPKSGVQQQNLTTGATQNNFNPYEVPGYPPGYLPPQFGSWEDYWRYIGFYPWGGIGGAGDVAGGGDTIRPDTTSYPGIDENSLRGGAGTAGGTSTGGGDRSVGTDLLNLYLPGIASMGRGGYTPSNRAPGSSTSFSPTNQREGVDWTDFIPLLAGIPGILRGGSGNDNKPPDNKPPDNKPPDQNNPPNPNIPNIPNIPNLPGINVNGWPWISPPYVNATMGAGANALGTAGNLLGQNGGYGLQQFYQQLMQNGLPNQRAIEGLVNPQIGYGQQGMQGAYGTLGQLGQGQGQQTSFQQQLQDALSGRISGTGLTPEYVAAMRSQVLEPSMEATIGRANQMGGGQASLGSGLSQELMRRTEKDFNDQLVRAAFENQNAAFGQANQLGGQQFAQGLGLAGQYGGLGNQNYQNAMAAFGIVPQSVSPFTGQAAGLAGQLSGQGLGAFSDITNAMLRGDYGIEMQQMAAKAQADAIKAGYLGQGIGSILGALGQYWGNQGGSNSGGGWWPWIIGGGAGNTNYGGQT